MHQTLIDIISHHRGLTLIQAKVALLDLYQSGHYHLDIWGITHDYSEEVTRLQKSHNQAAAWLQTVQNS